MGALGTWSAKCDAPASYTNARLIYFKVAGEAVLSRLERGRGEQSVEGDIDTARAVGPTRLALRERIKFRTRRDPNGITLETVIEVKSGQMRTLSAVRTDSGRNIIVNGKYIDGERDATLLTKCN